MRKVLLGLSLITVSAGLLFAQPVHINGVYYEIFVRSFYDSNGDGIGDLKGITQKLDYLNDGNPETATDLGITGIWLMPINDSPSYHGYDVTNYYSINPQYGTISDLKELLAEAHKRGIRIIMDYVMNHCSVRHPWYQKARAGDPFYQSFFVWSDTTSSRRGPWGQRLWHGREKPYHYGIFSGGLPDLNFENSAVRDSLFAAARFWIKDVGIDGFRLDAVKYLYEEGAILEDHPKTLAFWKQFGDSVRSWNPDAFTVGEAWTSTDVASRYVQGKKLDYVFEFDLAQALVKAAKTGNASELYTALSNVKTSYPEQSFGIFLSNHDQNRVIDELGDDLKKAELAAKLYLLLPGIPYLYYGEELGMKGSKPDEHIRRPMAWNTGTNAGFTTGKPWIDLPAAWQQRNVETAEANSTALLHTYRRFIRYRKQSQALSAGEYIPLPSSNTAVFSFLRKSGERWAWIVANVSSVQQSGISLDFTNTGLKQRQYQLKTPSTLKKPSSRKLGGSVKIEALNPYEVLVYYFEVN
jgi:glycosidase